MTMKQIPNIQPGEDFDRQVLYRSWMASMPEVAAPAGFDAAVLKRTRRGAMRHWWGIAVIAVFLAVVGGVTLLQDSTSAVVVARAPQSPLPLVDLWNLPPATVTEDVRFAPPAEPVRRAVVRSAPHGVAGH